MKKSFKRLVFLICSLLMLGAALTLSVCAAEPFRILFDNRPERSAGDRILLTFPDVGVQGDHRLVKDEDGAYLRLFYNESAKFSPYRIRRNYTRGIPKSYKYVCITYRTSDPLAASIQLRGTESVTTLVPNTKASGGEWTVSEPILLASDVFDYIVNEKLIFIEYTSTAKTSDIAIKELAFFVSASDAKKYYEKESDKTSGLSKLSIAGTDISKYRIVVSDDAADAVISAANSIKSHIKKLTGTELDIVTDKAPESEYEILVGVSRREESSAFLADHFNFADFHKKYLCDMSGGKIIISAASSLSIQTAADAFLSTYLYKDLTAPAAIEINAIERIFASDITTLAVNDYYKEAKNVSDPEVFTEDFETDKGYFTEDAGKDLWSYKDGKYTVSANDESISYIHVYESNVSVSAKFSPSESASGSAGLIARYSDESAYIKAGYDYALGEWYIEFREGEDFPLWRIARKKDTAPTGEFTLTLLCDGGTVKLSRGEELLLTAAVPHVSAGRVGLFAEEITLSVDDLSLVLLSGEGTILKNVEHTKIPVDEYLEGGSVVEFTGGTLAYQRKNNSPFKSYDGGATWVESEKWVDSPTYLNIIRLSNGSLLQITKGSDKNGSYFYARISNDDSKTWTDAGRICSGTHENGSLASTMNDHVTQISTGRIFFVLDYSKGQGDTRIALFEVYYSDDMGKTWQRSNTSPYDLEKTLSIRHSGECSIVECADGSLRMYNSWNDTGYVIYYESKDGGVTWSEYKELAGFTTSRSSMQIRRDPYGPTDTTYYMIWFNTFLHPNSPLTEVRTRLCLAYTEDGVNWTYLGDVWRFECRYAKKENGIAITHMVDPFIIVTEDSIICGSGISESLNADQYHNNQRQHIWTIARDTLTK